jgi:hypothetical protein
MKGNAGQLLGTKSNEVRPRIHSQRAWQCSGDMAAACARPAAIAAGDWIPEHKGCLAPTHTFWRVRSIGA